MNKLYANTRHTGEPDCRHCIRVAKWRATMKNKEKKKNTEFGPNLTPELIAKMDAEEAEFNRQRDTIEAFASKGDALFRLAR
jgi:hypothetical protein